MSIRKFINSVQLINLLVILYAFILIQHYPNCADAFPKQFTFELPDKQRMCFYESLTENKRYVLNFRVIKGGNNDVDVRISGPPASGHKEIYNKQRAHYDSYSFNADHGAGDYQFCFSNEFSTITHKQVFFELRPEIFDSLEVEAGGTARPTAMTQMETSLDNMHVHLSEVEEYQTMYRNQEAEGRNISEELNERVLFWSILVALSIVLIGFGQVTILKNFFSDKDTIKYNQMQMRASAAKL